MLYQKNLAIFLTFISLLLFFSGGCANVSTLQTARTLEVGENRFVVGGGYATVSGKLNQEDIAFSAPYLEGYYKRGVAENLDIGVKLTLLGTIAGDLKYQFLDMEGFAMATGFSLGYVNIGSNSLIDFIAPLYISYDLDDTFTIYSSPKYLLRLINGSSNAIGGSLGIKIGNKAGVFIESSYMNFLGTTTTSFQSNIGAFF